MTNSSSAEPIAPVAPAAPVASTAPVLTPALAAALWMLLACACFSTMNGIVRHLTDGLEPMVIVFFRCLFGMLAMLPLILRNGVHTLRTRRWWLHGARAVLAIFAMAAWFHALSRLGLAEATALSFTTPLFASIAAVVVLGEVMRARRWTATAIGFVGALIILRPGVAAIDPAALLVLGAALLMAVSQTMVKSLSGTDHPNSIVFWLVVMLMPLSLVPALAVWQTPDLYQFLWLAALGAVATLGHQSMTRSLAGADATAVYPIDFTRLLFAALIGFVIFGEVPDVWTWVGAAVIAGSAIYIAHREARLKIRQRAVATTSLSATP